MRELTERQLNLNAQDTARLNSERAGRPGLVDLPTAVQMIREGNHPNSFYDHVNDRAYVRILNDDGTPSNNYRAIDTIDPNPANREFRTVED